MKTLTALLIFLLSLASYAQEQKSLARQVFDLTQKGIGGASQISKNYARELPLGSIPSEVAETLATSFYNSYGNWVALEIESRLSEQELMTTKSFLLSNAGDKLFRVLGEAPFRFAVSQSLLKDFQKTACKDAQIKYPAEKLISLQHQCSQLLSNP